MIPIPTRRLLALASGWAAFGLAASLRPGLHGAWTGTGLGLGLLALADAVLVPLLGRALEARREVAPSLALGRRNRVRVHLRGAGALSWRLRLWDHAPEDLGARGQGRAFRMPAQGTLDVTYPILPVARGCQAFGPVQVRQSSLLGLVSWDRHLPCPTEVRVYPDFAALSRYALLATDHRLASLGILKRPRRGEGLDFHQLRDYRTGDSLRRIDWKASRRAQRLISRDYQDERDQQVVFLLDCGRRMRGQEPGELPHFDQALNALFLLAFVALRQGDAVGVQTFADETPRHLAPRKGVGAMDGLYHHLYDLQPSTRASDGLAAARHLRDGLRKRSLVVLVTNLREDEAGTLLPALELLRQKHLVLLANLREAALDHLLDRIPATLDDALTQAAAHDLAARREHLLRGLTARGHRIVDVPPRDLPVALVNRYLELKAAGVF